MTPLPHSEFILTQDTWGPPAKAQYLLWPPRTSGGPQLGQQCLSWPLLLIVPAGVTMNLALGAWPVLGSQPLLISPRISAGYLQGDTQVRAWQGERESRGSGSPSLGAWHSPALSRWARCSLPMAACSLLMTLPLCNPNPSCSAKSLPSFKAPQGTMVFKHLPAPGGRGLPCISATCNHAPHYHTNLRSLKELQTGGLLPGSLSGTRTMFTPRKWSSANFTQVTRYPRCAPQVGGGCLIHPIW